MQLIKLLILISIGCQARVVLQEKQSECLLNEVRGGYDAKEGRYPYVVSLQYSKILEDGSSEFSHLCGATLIAPNLLLTAAHCIWYKLERWDYRLDQSSYGNLYENQIWAALSPQCRNQDGTLGRIAVKEFYIHENYDGTAEHGFDIAVLVLDIPFNLFKQSFSNFRGSKSRQLIDDDKVFVIGWGVRRYSDLRKKTLDLAFELQETTILFVSDDTCKDLLKERTSAKLDPKSMVCFMNDDINGTCRGDSGGPAFIKGDDADKDIQVGISSWGPNSWCEQVSAPSIFTELSPFVDWIQQIVDSSSIESPALPSDKDQDSLTQNGVIVLENGLIISHITEDISATAECKNEEANYSGENVEDFIFVENVMECCSRCQRHPQCNTYVYCPREEGCRYLASLDAPVVQYKRCDLKYQQEVMEGELPKVYGGQVDKQSDFLSGIVSDKLIIRQQGTSCSIVNDVTANGIYLYGQSKIVEGAQTCCDLCNQHRYCNAWRYCPKQEGCGPHRVSWRQCDMRYQANIANGGKFEYQAADEFVDFIAGSVPPKKIGEQCIIRDNVNYQGAYILGTQTENKGECCEKCSFYNGCNVFVFCGKPEGCQNLNQTLPYKTCDLKYQAEVENYNYPQAWDRGDNVDFTGGVIPGKSLQVDCFILSNSNLKGAIQTQILRNSAGSCCDACKGLQNCNVWVYCDKEEGCQCHEKEDCAQDSTIVPYQTCSLKFQEQVHRGNTPEAWEDGINTQFTSGFIFGKASI